jgi:hypothetical protein
MPKSLTKAITTPFTASLGGISLFGADRTIAKLELDRRPILSLRPRIDEFARQNPFVGAKVGPAHQTDMGTWVQEFQNATAYGGPSALASEIHEVHGAIRDRYKSFGGPDGFLGLPLTNESPCLDGQGKYNHFERGSIFWHPTTGAREIHGEIRNHWESLGWERGWLGYPISDELSLEDVNAGRISVFQNGAIYWWPECGARSINDVCLQYTGFVCFGETDADEGSDEDEPYATFGIMGPDNIRGMVQTKVYQNVHNRTGQVDFIELYRGKPRGLAIHSILQEHSGNDDQLEKTRGATKELVDKAGPLIQKFAMSVPVIGPVLGPLSGVAWDILKKDIVDALNSFVEHTLGFGDRPLGTDFITLTPQQLVLLATRPQGHALTEIAGVPWRFETQLLSRYGASYKLYFNIFPV